MCKKIILLILLMLIWICFIKGQSKIVEATGKGLTEKGAVNDALRIAVEMAFGVELKSSTLVNDGITVSDSIKTNSQGVVKGYKVKSKNNDNEGYNVTIEAEVMNVMFNKEEDYMNKIIQFPPSQNIDMISFVIESVGDVKVDTINDADTLYVGLKYRLSFNVLKPCYLYVFYYMPDDINNPYIQPLYPFTDEQNRKLEKGKLVIPHDNGFRIGYPAGIAYIKIIALSDPLPLHFEARKLEGGGFFTSVHAIPAEVFYSALEIYKNHNLTINSKILSFNIDVK